MTSTTAPASTTPSFEAFAGGLALITAANRRFATQEIGAMAHQAWLSIFAVEEYRESYPASHMDRIGRMYDEVEALSALTGRTVDAILRAGGRA